MKQRKIQDGGGRRFGRSTAREIWNLGKVKFGSKTRETEGDRTEQRPKSEIGGKRFRLKTGEVYGWVWEGPRERNQEEPGGELSNEQKMKKQRWRTEGSGLKWKKKTAQGKSFRLGKKKRKNRGQGGKDLLTARKES